MDGAVGVNQGTSQVKFDTPHSIAVAPLYRKEAEDAIKVIHGLEAALDAALSTP